MTAALTLLLWTLIIHLCQRVGGVCFFNQDVQGVYLTQSTTSRGSEIDYLEVVIQHDSIPVWGRCHRRFGNNVILYDMAGDINCMRCFHVVSRSTHLLQIHTEGLERCYTNEGAALTRCPTEQRIAENTSVEIMLYKTRNLVENRVSLPVYCPIEGKFRFTYDHDDGTETDIECPDARSVLSNCPTGNRITIGFRQCSFHDFEKSFECLGFWNGTGGQHYLALRDPTVDHTSPSRGAKGPPAPKYRCAMFEREPSSGRVFLAFSSDSTCFNNLHSARAGFESLVLEPQLRPSLPQIVNLSRCEFPSWSQGQWEQLQVSGGSLTFTDLHEFKTVSVECVGPVSKGLFPVYAVNQCGDESFSCLAIQERSPNVIEFQISVSGGPYLMEGLCDVPSDLAWPRWITQGRVDRFRESPCPVAGEYTGTIPDESTLCAKLYSDCNNLEIMFYTVYMCENKSRVLEEREYRCLGQWAETGVTYTYTERRDVLGYECFAGVVVTSDQIFIIEAGINCQRGLKPLANGMKLLQQATCQNSNDHLPVPVPPRLDPTWRESATHFPEVNNSVIEEQLPPSSGAAILSWTPRIFVLVYFILR